MVKIKRIAVLLLALLYFLPSVFAADSFVDLDGDGINDKLPDINNNTIPDKFEKNQQTPATLFTGFTSVGETDDLAILTLPQQFKLNFSKISPVTQNRFDFDREFNTRLGGTSSGGGSCAGGLCF